MHLALAEYMHMYVVDRLAPQVVAVHDYAEAFLATLLFGEALGREEDMTGERLIIFLAEVVQRRDVFLWDDQEMHRRLGSDVPEGDDLIVFIELVGGNVPRHDLAEQTIHGMSPEV